MSEEHSSQIRSQAGGTHPAGDVTQLVRRAMSFFQTDRAAAWRCLTDASALLAKESDGQDGEWRAAIDAPRRGGLPKWRINRVLEYIEAHLGSRITVGELADFVALSKNHFSRAFKQSFGACLMTYVATRRVERAKLMMLSSRERLSDIAVACGFADQSHLNRYFRRVVGISPGSWRRGVAAPNLGSPRRTLAAAVVCAPAARSI
jgi:transcriptional regulator GlxA family with amidase domain